MAGLATAWELTGGEWRQQLESITVYQRGWRLGGKGASSRGEHDRVEEHGLHVLLGYYDATFRVLRQAYDELDRSRSDPASPIKTWREAVEPAGDVGLAELRGGSWDSFVTRFSRNDRVPGEAGAEDAPIRLFDLAARAIGLLVDFHTSLASPTQPPGPYLSASPQPRRAGTGAAFLKGTAVTAVAAVFETLAGAARAGQAHRIERPLAEGLAAVLQSWRDTVRSVVALDDHARRTWQLVDLVVTNLRGMLVDGLLSGTTYDRIDHLDYRAWLRSHGAGPETVDSPILRGMYDLTFAYEAGDRSRPRFSAGLGLELAMRMLFDFKGSIFWRMRAGMGEVVFAPLYQALVQRGVEFRFFRRLERLGVGSERSVVTIDLICQSELRGSDDYQPLIRVDGLAAWPSHPLGEQLAADPGDQLESHWFDESVGTLETLQAGRDFDVAVLAVSVGMVPHVAGELIEVDSAWRDMVENVATVGTKSAQLWMRVTEGELGWKGPVGVTLSGLGESFDTWASMSHLLPMEGWPKTESPRSLAYFCGSMPDVVPVEAGRWVRASAEHFLEHEVASLWPQAVGADGFRWDLLWDEKARTGRNRLDGQYLRANVDPSDRYVQSLPGSGRFRIEPGRTGFVNLAIAGDWTRCGLDAGCVEAATRSGVLAARAILDGSVRAGRPSR